MVSQLSASLLGAAGGTTNSTTSSAPTVDAGIGGRTCNSSSKSTEPPDYINLAPPPSRKSHHPRSARSGSVDPNKRQRIAEENYAALTARDDIARGGLVCPKLRLNKPRMLFAAASPSGIDMSKVTHRISSSDLTPTKASKSSPSCWSFTSAITCEASRMLLSNMVKESQSFYEMPAPPARGTSASSNKTPESPPSASGKNNKALLYAESSTSSMTESSDDGTGVSGTGSSQGDVDEEQSSESANTTTTTDYNGGSSSAGAPSSAGGAGRRHPPEQDTKSCISMGQALSISKQPRYVCC